MPVLTPGATYSVEIPDRPVPSVEKPPPATASVAVVRGPRGPQGPPGTGVGTEIQQVTPAATWTIPIPPEFTRAPAVTVYVDGEQVITDISADNSNVTIQFPNPTAGIAVLI